MNQDTLVPTNHKRKLLVIDDDPYILDVIKDLFQEEYNVVQAKDAVDLPLKVTAHDPDIILMDIMLPRVTGDAALADLRLKGYTTPVVLYSAKIDKTQERGLEHLTTDILEGQAFIVSKPFDYEELAKLLRSIIAKYYSEDAGERDRR